MAEDNHPSFRLVEGTSARGVSEDINCIQLIFLEVVDCSINDLLIPGILIRPTIYNNDEFEDHIFSWQLEQALLFTGNSANWFYFVFVLRNSTVFEELFSTSIGLFHPFVPIILEVERSPRMT